MAGNDRLGMPIAGFGVSKEKVAEVHNGKVIMIDRVSVHSLNKFKWLRAVFLVVEQMTT